MKLSTAIVALSLLAGGSAHAEGGVVFGLDYGFGGWSFDRQHLATQLPKPNADEGDLAARFADNVHTAQAATLKLGFNILGHSTVEGFVTATGWDITSASRGGGGFVGGTASWHPLQIWIPERKYDAEVLLGYAYGLVGQKKAIAGNAFVWGLRGEYFLGKVFFVGAEFRMHHLFFHSFYRDYDQRAVEGNTLTLADGSGGTFYSLQAQIGFQVDVLE